MSIFNNLFISRVSFFALRPRLRIQPRQVEFVWLGLHLEWLRVGRKPVRLLYAGKRTMSTGYKPKGFPGGILADYVPKGMYCYTRKDGEVVHCPFWDSDLARPEHTHGFCHLLGKGDWEHWGLLWDQVKECDYNLGEEDAL